jgi:CxxC-x17-CxxC domain-containing protein
MIVFRIGAADAEFLENEFEPEFVIQDMVNLPNYRIYLKLMVDGVTSRPFSARTLPPFKLTGNGVSIEEIIQISRKRYARPRSLVEKEINEWSGVMTQAETYEAVCSICGAQTIVKFKPIEGAPIYCRDCLGKIKTGELKRIPTERDFAAKPKTRYFADLSQIGIEFENPQETKTPRSSQGGEEKKFERPRRTEHERRMGNPSRPAVPHERLPRENQTSQEREESVTSKKRETVQEISLTTLESKHTREEKTTASQELNLEDLRSSIREALDKMDQKP